MKHSDKSVLSWLLHLSLWSAAFCDWWGLVTLVNVGISVYLYLAGPEWWDLAMISTLGFLVAQTGLWFAVAEQWKRSRKDTRTRSKP